MKIEKNNTNKNKKKIVGALAIGGLVLSAPFSAFAFNDNNMNPSSFDKKDLRQDNLNSLLIEPNYEKQVEKLELAIEKKIEQANLLLENVELSDSIEDDLYEIIGEFAELESYLEDLNLSGEEAEMLKEIFLEDKEEATGLVSEFRDIITANLTSDEIEVLKEVIKPEVETKIREADMRVMAPKFTAESLEIIDSDLAEEYKNGVLSEEEVALSVKAIMDELSDDERHDLMEEIRTNMEENGIEMPNKENRGVIGMEGKMGGMRR